MSSGGSNRTNLSTARFSSVDSFSLSNAYQAKNTVNLYINDVAHTVSLNKVENNYGGYDRIYFTCPRCKSRVRLLYATEETLFCRNCVRLSYPSQRCGRDSKAYYRLIPLFRRLNVNENFSYMLKHIPQRPAYMRHNTYNKIIWQITALQNQHCAYFVGLTQKILGKNGYTQL